ncbi:MAG: 2-oxoacid:ferredoxin oxidoreductase subunit beta [Deltaproteobacteria bacterium CG11_big_fil_rev_8_21_14_0_20_47_16]|nr:MAG: 2-oxoacid:ferredoxin oxidoreductase subunit beta [Deltaproteobacteria bacterium CG11_big_fil_rev_8_21_14_0_20_47_16]
MTTEATAAVKLTRKDFVTDQDVRWCPGCGDYAILSQVQRVLPELGVPREKIVFISGIGCSSRFPYYINTYGFHTIHGRAPTLASGLKISRPDLCVWIATGDGDGLSIGGNHLIHILRRNLNVQILLFNNRIYGLTKGQYSPTSEEGKITKSTPYGSPDHPFNPIGIALGAGATFVARSIDVENQHMPGVLLRAAQHKGASFVEVFQNCNIFNDGAFDYTTDKENKLDRQLRLENGKPMVFGKNNDKGIRMNSQMQAEVIEFKDGLSEKDCLIHDETNPAIAYMLSQMVAPKFPTPMGVFFAIQKTTYEEVATEQINTAKKTRPLTIEQLLKSGDVWTVK